MHWDRQEQILPDRFGEVDHVVRRDEKGLVRPFGLYRTACRDVDYRQVFLVEPGNDRGFKRLQTTVAFETRARFQIGVREDAEIGTNEVDPAVHAPGADPVQLHRSVHVDTMMGGSADLSAQQLRDIEFECFHGVSPTTRGPEPVCSWSAFDRSDYSSTWANSSSSIPRSASSVRRGASALKPLRTSVRIRSIRPSSCWRTS